MFFSVHKENKTEAIKNLIREHLNPENKKHLLEWLEKDLWTYVQEHRLCYNCFVKMRYGGYVIDNKSKKRRDGSFEKKPSKLICPKCNNRRGI